MIFLQKCYFSVAMLPPNQPWWTRGFRRSLGEEMIFQDPQMKSLVWNRLRKNIFSALLPPLWRRETMAKTKHKTTDTNILRGTKSLNTIFCLVEWPQHRNGQGLAETPVRPVKSDVSSSTCWKEKLIYRDFLKTISSTNSFTMALLWRCFNMPQLASAFSCYFIWRGFFIPPHFSMVVSTQNLWDSQGL